MKKWIEALRLAKRNRDRRKLVNEYGRNLARNKEILAALGLMNAAGELDAVAERLLDDWPAARGLIPQAEIVRGTAVNIAADLAERDAKAFVAEHGGTDAQIEQVTERAIFGTATFNGKRQAFKIAPGWETGGLKPVAGGAQ